MSRALWAGFLGVGLGLSCGPDLRPGTPAPFPLDKRVPWTTSTVVGSPDPPLPYRAVPAFPKLKFRNSLYIACEPGTDRVTVVEQHGRTLAFRNDPAVEKTDVFLQLKGLWSYSIMFHPKYAENHWVYVFANGPENTEPNKKNRILRFEVKEGKCDPASEQCVIEWVSNGHDGGEMAFGPDGMLYISAGDGTTDSDGNVTGQDITDLNSGVLRIDVEHPDPGRNYSIPKDNPFLHVPGARGELWAYGFRNPWRMCFDPRTGDLWVGDIGQDLWEMVEVVKKGDNYGWSVYEGGHPFYLNRKLGPTPVTPPVIVHHHSEMRSITGGFVYYGPKHPELQGAYLYGDYSTGRVWGARYRDGKIAWHRELAKTSLQILGLTPDASGEIYLVDYAGAVFRLEPKPPKPPHPFPRTLSASGVFSSVAGHRTHPGLVPYTVNSPLWSDGASKERFIGLPGDSQIAFTEDGAWQFPEATVLVKTFSIETEAGHPESRKRIETRFLTLQENEWVGYSYFWNDDQTEGTLVEKAGVTRDYRIRDPRAPGGAHTQTWYYPSRADCMVCHSRAAGFVLGLHTIQMNKENDYGAARENQLAALELLGVFKVNLLEYARAQEAPWQAIGEIRRKAKRKVPEPPKALKGIDTAILGLSSLDPLQTAVQMGWAAVRKGVIEALEKEPRFTTRLPRRPDEYRRLVDPADETAQRDARARAYLHANCAQCHVEAGGGNSAIDLHVATKPDRMRLLDVKPLHDAFQIRDPRLVAPGDPERSVLYWRLTHRGPGQMPPLATSMVDPQAARLIRDWIASLKSP